MYDHLAAFARQAGYAAFSVSASKLIDVWDSISRQRDHHATTSFQDEYPAFLRRHGMEWDERYVWD
ncbi:MAG TPA: hypothetical protein VF796_18685 [Humisphaera sp.]